MINNTELDIYFQNIQERYFRILVKTYNQIVNQANDKEYAQLVAGCVIAMINFGNQNPYIQEIIENFKHTYKLGLSINSVLNKIPDLKQKHLKLMLEEEKKNTKTQYHYKNNFYKFLGIPTLKTEFTSRGKYIFNSDFINEIDNKKIVKLLIKYYAGQRFFYEHLKTDMETITEDNIFERLFPEKKEFIKIKKYNSLFEIVIELCNHVRYLIEEKGALKRDEITEKIYQDFFYSTSNTYKLWHNFDINREPDIGVGEPDFKISKGHEIVIIELKLSSNENLLTGYTKQLPRYNKSEKVNESIYLVLKNDNNEKKVDKLIELENQYNGCPKLIIINGQKQITASKIKK